MYIKTCTQVEVLQSLAHLDNRHCTSRVNGSIVQIQPKKLITTCDGFV